MLVQVNGNAYECSDKMAKTMISMAQISFKVAKVKYAIVALERNGFMEMKKETYKTMESFLSNKFAYEKKGFKVHYYVR